MPYDNETTRYKIPWWETGEISSGDSNEAAAKNIEWPLEIINKVVAGEACECTLGAGFEVSAGAGLSVNVAAGSGQIGGLAIYAAAPTNKAGLPDATATIYIYLKRTAATKRDRSFTIEISLSGPPMADAIYIATCNTSGGAVNAVNNSPASRTPRLPGSIAGIPGLRVVAPAGAQYTSPKTAIEACIAGDVVYICAGTYDIPSTITIPANGITIIGADRETVVLNFTAADATHCINLSTRTGIDVRDFTIQAVAGNTGCGITAGAAHYARLENLYITGAALSAGIACTGATRVRVRTCRITIGGASGGIVLSGSPDSLIAFNIIDISTTAGSIGIQIVIESHRCLIVGNNIVQSASGSLYSVYSYNNDHVRIVHNLIRVTDPAAAAKIIRVRAYSRVCSGNVIANNHVLSVGPLGVGIYLSTDDPYTLDDTRISDNDVFSAATGVHIVDARCRYTFAHDNMIRTCTTGVTDGGTSSHLVDNA